MAIGAVPGRLPATLFPERVGLLGTEEAFKLGSLIREVEEAAGERVIRANLGQPDFELPPHIADEVVRAIREGLTTYCDPQAEAGLDGRSQFDAIVRYVEARGSEVGSGGRLEPSAPAPAG